MLWISGRNFKIPLGPEYREFFKKWLQKCFIIWMSNKLLRENAIKKYGSPRGHSERGYYKLALPRSQQARWSSTVYFKCGPEGHFQWKCTWTKEPPKPCHIYRAVHWRSGCSQWWRSLGLNSSQWLSNRVEGTQDIVIYLPFFGLTCLNWNLKWF
jgi:hypothetical protein